MNPLIINPDRSGVYYSLFYFLAFLIGLAALMMEGRKNRFPFIPWLMVIGTAFLFFIIGCRIINYTSQEWFYLIRLEPIPYATSLSILGGILFSIPGIWLAKKCLSFSNKMMDAFAFVLPLGFMVERVGCLLAGCCYGSITNVPWSIHYGVNSLAYLRHVHEGLLDPTAPYSLAVHPVQLYEMLCCFAIILLLKKIRRHIHAKGNLFLISITLYGAFRFVLEFLRSSEARTWNFLQLNFVQWSILVFIVFMIIIILYRERISTERASVSGSGNLSTSTIFLYSLFLTTLFIITSRFLSPVEILSLNLVALAVILELLRSWFFRITVPCLRAISMTLPFMAMLLMSQTLPENLKKDKDKLSYMTLSAGITGGSSNMYNGNFGSGGCSGPYIPSTAVGWNNSYSGTGFGLAYTEQQALYQNMTFGMNVFFGQHTEDAFTPATSVNHQFSTFGISPYFIYNRKNIGLGFGMHVGDFTRIVQTEANAPTSVVQNSIYPSFNFRLGALDQGFLEYKFANQFPTCFPALTHQILFGIGTKRKNRPWRGGAIRIGTASNAGFIIAPSTAIGKHIILDTYVGWGGAVFSNYEHVSNNIVSASLHYKIFKKGE